MTLHPTDEERDQPHISTLVPIEVTTVLDLDDITKNIITPQFHVEQLDSEGNDGLSIGEAKEQKTTK